MTTERRYERVSIYLDHPRLRERIKVAAARKGVSVSGYCLDAVRRRLGDEGFLPPTPRAARSAANALDRLRSQVGPTGVKARDLVDEGRTR